MYVCTRLSACCSRQDQAIYYLPTYQAISRTQLGRGVRFIGKRPFSCIYINTYGDEAFNNSDLYLFAVAAHVLVNNDMMISLMNNYDDTN